MQLMRALEIGLEVEKGSLTRRCILSASDLRLNRCPALGIQDLRDGSVSRVSPHTEFGVIPLLLQDEIGGLEIEDRTRPNSFLPMAPRQTEMIVNASDALQRWTNGVLRAGVHRVTIPHGMKEKGDAVLPGRFSMA
jgi:isopenicillin N synthase-like dioxygenase